MDMHVCKVIGLTALPIMWPMQVTEPLGPADAAKARRVEKVVPVTKMVPACTTQVGALQSIGQVDWLVD